jgi:hypothetical protein
MGKRYHTVELNHIIAHVFLTDLIFYVMWLAPIALSVRGNG